MVASEILTACRNIRENILIIWGKADIWIIKVLNAFRAEGTDDQYKSCNIPSEYKNTRITEV